MISKQICHCKGHKERGRIGKERKCLKNDFIGKLMLVKTDGILVLDVTILLRCLGNMDRLALLVIHMDFK